MKKSTLICLILSSFLFHQSLISSNVSLPAAKPVINIYSLYPESDCTIQFTQDNKTSFLEGYCKENLERYRAEREQHVREIRRKKLILVGASFITWISTNYYINRSLARGKEPYWSHIPRWASLFSFVLNGVLALDTLPRNTNTDHTLSNLQTVQEVSKSAKDKPANNSFSIIAQRNQLVIPDNNRQDRINFLENKMIYRPCTLKK